MSDALAGRLARVRQQLYDRGAEPMVWELLLDGAARYFEECPEDFCLQHFSGETIIFGGTNRVVWSVRRGFQVDRAYCTARFLAHADQLD